MSKNIRIRESTYNEIPFMEDVKEYEPSKFYKKKDENGYVYQVSRNPKPPGNYEFWKFGVEIIKGT